MRLGEISPEPYCQAIWRKYLKSPYLPEKFYHTPDKKSSGDFLNLL
nr:MAG TPA: hypothetical protein [Bacteriophage sp.]